MKTGTTVILKGNKASNNDEVLKVVISDITETTIQIKYENGNTRRFLTDNFHYEYEIIEIII